MCNYKYIYLSNMDIYNNICVVINVYMYLIYVYIYIIRYDFKCIYVFNTKYSEHYWL